MFAGAGFAGVEVLAELRDLVAKTLPRHPRLAGVEPRWLLLDGGPGFLTRARAARPFAHQILDGRGVEILTEISLAELDERGVTLTDGRHLARRLVLPRGGFPAVR
ncbi:MAG: hypothetical protein ICV69_14145 [Thermoleophilaceae bacterium]|nr:hypothetical protein [Thermoleophilaceae bacterium]